MRVGAIQMNAGADPGRNLETAERLVRAAAGQGASFIVLPEKWSVLGTAEDLRAGAQALDGPAISWARAVAAELGIDLLAGSIYEDTGHGRLGANTSVHAGPDGEIRAVYRKIHLFDVEVDGRRYAESETEVAGDEVVVSTLVDGTVLGLSICYDVRFPELYRALAGRDARIMAIPAAFTLATTRDHWETLVRARAIENQCFVIAPNQIGEHPGGIRTGGRSLIVDPWGVVLAQAGDAETAIVAELDMSRIDAVRAGIPALRHRRPAVYAAEPGVRA
ncbi:MAG TPA: carbon-nitrogen hydrolase family protein [Solirubrobacteraceae bacterium]|nr:carbon-nitrogen hydrolase family protein [Solirubrobacteraceae bacterium]